MEEEKKEHVEKAGDLLKWVSNLSKTLSKEEGEKAEKTDLPKQQVYRCLFTKHYFLFLGFCMDYNSKIIHKYFLSPLQITIHIFLRT